MVHLVGFTIRTVKLLFAVCYSDDQGKQDKIGRTCEHACGS